MTQFKKQQIEISTRYGTTTLSALVKDGLAVHRGMDVKRFSITHVASGLNLFWTRDQLAAKQAIVELTQAGVDWSRDGEDIGKEMSERGSLYKMVKECLGKYQYGPQAKDTVMGKQEYAGQIPSQAPASIDKGELFREAHKLARSARRPGCTYKEDFAAALRIVWTSLKSRTSQALIAA